MRARRSWLLGWAAVAVYAGALAAVVVTTVARDDVDRDGIGAAPAERFVEAWARARRATFVTSGTFERRSEVTGAVIASEDEVVQRPPRRVHRQLGGVDGRDDDRLLVCPAPPAGVEEREPCRLGSPGGLTYDESVEREVDGLRSLLLGRDPLYEVRSDGDCFDLELLRSDPRAPFGIGARFCFDAATGAPTDHEVRYQGGISEVVVVTEVRAEVTDADLEP